MVAPTPSGYSARVRLELIVSGQRFPPAQIGGGRIIFDAPVVLPGSEGELFAHIDDHVQQWRVRWEPSDQPRRIVPAEFREVAYMPHASSTTAQPTA